MFSVLGSAAIGSLLAAVVVLAKGLEDALDSNVTRWTLHDNRFALAVLVVASIVAWFHVRVYLAERNDYEPAGEQHLPQPPKRVVLATPDIDLARELESTTGISAVVWHRNDQVHAPAIDLARLGAQITSQSGDELVVVIGADGPLVIPVDANSISCASGDLRPCR